MTKNKNHWYDGWFYDSIIAPNQDKLFIQIKDLVKPDSTIIDIGCGTGRLEFFLANKCKSLLGIDLSRSNIDRANKTLFKYPDERISFLHSNISEVINSGNIKFDYAVLTYVIHEVDEEDRIDLLKEIAQVADKILIGDYRVPKPKGLEGFLSKAIEFMAGREHYRNYKSYMSNGGIKQLVEQAGLKIINELSTQSSTNHIIVIAK